MSITSALFTLFAMRRGIMIVGESESKSLLSDISKLPVIIFHFCGFIPNEISAMFRRGAHLGGLIAIAAFGIFSQVLIWALLNKPSWTYSGGKDVTLLMTLAVILSSIVYDRKQKNLSS